MNDGIRQRLAAEIREGVPKAPGVYAYCDREGRLLYVGKSVNLRQRMGSYFRQDPLRAELHLGQLVSGIRRFAWWQTRSELLALLMEDALIKEYLPPHNTRQRETLENRYLELTAGEFPACVVAEHASDFGEREVFGPVKDRYFAERVRDILRETLGVRTCSDPEPSGRCLEHDLGRCSGPCRGAVAPEEYRVLVSGVRDFLTGDAGEVLRRLVDARDRASERRSFEEAARLRDAIETCRRFESHERFARRFTTETCSIRLTEDGVEHRFARGALTSPRDVVVAQGTGGRPIEAEGTGFDLEVARRRAATALRRRTSTDRRALADRTRIVCNWVRARSEGCEIRFEQPEDSRTVTADDRA